MKWSEKRCGSIEYLAPEAFLGTICDPRALDMWAIGIIYMEMRLGKRPWEFSAEGANEAYDRYLRERTGLWGYRPIENLKNVSCIQYESGQVLIRSRAIVEGRLVHSSILLLQNE